MVKDPLASAEDSGDMVSIPGSGISSEGRNATYSSILARKILDIGAWQAKVLGVTKSQT